MLTMKVNDRDKDHNTKGHSTEHINRNSGLFLLDIHDPLLIPIGAIIMFFIDVDDKMMESASENTH